MTMKKAVILLLFTSVACCADTIFLDNNPGIINGSKSYDPASRTCGNGSYTVYTNLSDASQALAAAKTLYVRAGTYSQPSVGKYITVHGSDINYWTGVLDITARGTPQKHIVISAYKNELVIIQAKQEVSHYNPDPADTGFRKSSHYYPNPAIGIHGAYVDVIGFRTYGQVVITGHDITLESCDLGGGGPHMNQGQVIALNGTENQGVYNVLIRSNKIHHSCWGESDGNGAALMGYNFSCIIENNEFCDNFGPDIGIKDTGGQQGREIIIRYNFFMPTSINPSGNAGIHGHNQDRRVDRVTIHNNIFLEKATGISFRMPARLDPMLAYCNTFVNCGFNKNDSGDIGDWINTSADAYNNLYYHSRRGQRFYDIQTKPLNKLKSDYNLFFSTEDDTQFKHLYRPRATTLAAWQQYSQLDGNSLWKDPEFVNPSGSRPRDFKRNGSTSDVTGSPYGSVCGAYVTGNEVIGICRESNN